MSNPTLQHNTQAGPLIVAALVSLLGQRGRLVKPGATPDGRLGVQPVTAATDVAPFVLVADGDAGHPVTIAPFTAESNRRVFVTGAGQAGDVLALNADGTLSVAAGGAAGVAIAEENFVDGQEALVRPWFSPATA
jgi:hypothetical protein